MRQIYRALELRSIRGIARLRLRAAIVGAGTLVALLQGGLAAETSRTISVSNVTHVPASQRRTAIRVSDQLSNGTDDQDVEYFSGSHPVEPASSAELPTINSRCACEPTPWHGIGLPVGDDGGHCPSYWFVQVEGLFFDRSDDHCDRFSPDIAFDGFDLGSAARVTVGRQFDCLDAYEFSILSPLHWSDSDEALDAGGLLFNPFDPQDILLGSFDNAVAQQIQTESELQSFEINKRWSGWGVVSTTLGLRYVNLEEEFRFTSLNLAGDTGDYRVETTNHLFGAQWGGEFYYPLHPRCSIGAFIKLGGYMNFEDARTRVRDAGDLVIDNCAEHHEFAFLGEAGAFANFFITDRLTLQAGYQLGYLQEVAEAVDQVEFSPGQNAGSDLDSDGTLLFSGATIGLALAW